MASMQVAARWDEAASPQEQPDYDPAIQGFLQCVTTNLTTGYSKPTTEETKEFVPIKLVEKYLADNDSRKLNNILAALFPGSVPPVDAVHIIRDYLRVISILLRIGKGRYIYLFTSYDLSDKKLPFDPENRPRRFPLTSDDFYLRFCTEQWKFCVPVLEHNVTDLCLDSDTILPIIYKRKLNTGGSAVLHQITLYAAYDELRRPNSPRPSSAERNAHTYVLKTYTSKDAETYYHNEVRAFRQLKMFNKPNTNIIGFYGSYIHGDTFNIILEFADRGSLAQHFKETTPPSSSRDIINTWSSLFEVIPALVCIHDVESEDSDGLEIFQGWHQDIKPQNLLVMSDSSKSPYEWPIKLADLGISHFSRKPASQRDGTARDAHGTRTYGAPECYRSSDLFERQGLRVSQKVDIWSLGCVYSEAAVWIALGPVGIESYRQERKKATAQIKPTFNGGDCFHDGEKVLDVVLQMHKDIQKIVRGSDYITEKVLQVMVSEMLEPWSARPSAEQLRNKSQRIIVEANELLNGVGHRNLFNHLVMTNSTLTNSYGKAREPPNVSPPPWEVGQQHPRLSRPVTWNAPSSSRPVSGMAPAPQRMSADVHGITDRSILERQNSLNVGDHAASFRQSQELVFDGRNGHSDASHSDIAKIDEDEHEPINPISKGCHTNFRAPTPPASMEIANESVHQPPSTFQLSNGQQLFKEKETSGDTAKPALSFVELRKFKDAKKKKRVTAEDGLPFYWLLPRLAERDQVFLIDNSATMRPHWQDMTDLFGVIAWLIKDADPDGIELYFTVSDGRPIKAKHTTPLLAAINSKSQAGMTDINLSLSRILDQYKSRLQHQKVHRSFWKTAGKQVRPMTVYVLTDGRWESPADAGTPIRSLVKKLEDLGLQRSQVGIQFISFGDDSDGLARLAFLDDGLKLGLDIVDTEPWTGNIWKMLLGAINENFDGKA